MSVDPAQQLEISRQREELRQKAGPFKTMKSVSPETEAQLMGWKQPRHAYVLFESKVYWLNEQRWGTSLFTLNVAERPEQTSKIHDYVMKKGFRVIHYANFPTMDHPNAAIRAKALLHAGKDKINPWDELAHQCRTYMNLVPNAPALINELERKLADAEARAAAAEAKQNGDGKNGSERNTAVAATERSQGEGRRGQRAD